MKKQTKEICGRFRERADSAKQRIRQREGENPDSKEEFEKSSASMLSGGMIRLVYDKEYEDGFSDSGSVSKMVSLLS